MSVLGTCWGLDVSGGDPNRMKIKLKLPNDSPISVTKVMVIDAVKNDRCWTARWKDDNYNKQNNQWIEGTDLDFDPFC